MMMRLSPFNLPLDSFAAKQPGLADSCQNTVSILPLCLPSFYRSLYTYKFTTEDPAVQFQEEIIFLLNGLKFHSPHITCFTNSATSHYTTRSFHHLLCNFYFPNSFLSSCFITDSLCLFCILGGQRVYCIKTPRV